MIRQLQKGAALVDRGGPGKARCDLCGERPATDYHEIVSRGRTVKNPPARAASYDKHLCACLCHQCHLHGGVNNPAVAARLLQGNIERYGYDAVRAAWDRLVALMRRAPNVPFPAP